MRIVGVYMRMGMIMLMSDYKAVGGVDTSFGTRTEI